MISRAASLLIWLLSWYVLGISGAANPYITAEEVQPSDLLLLFHRPTEPVLTLRGLYRDTLFDIPWEYLPERFYKLRDEISSYAKYSSVRRVPIKRIPIRESLYATRSQIEFNDVFYINDPQSVNALNDFYHFFMDQETIEDLLAAGVWARLNFNPEMILEAMHTAILDRQDTQGVLVPEMTQYFADQFVDSAFFSQARETMWLYASDPEKRDVIPIIQNGTAEMGREDGMWFYREDPGLSLLHRHWHTLYPYIGEANVVIKNRRGELFTYLHRQMQARYNANRFNLGIPRAKGLDLKQPLREGYTSKFVMLQTTTCFTSRPSNTMLQGEMIPVIQRWIDAAKAAIYSGRVISASNGTINVSGNEGLDLIEDLLEAVPLLSPNYNLYGNIHNDLHLLVANSTNPWGLFDENKRIVSTMYAVRDPAFYNIHGYMDDLYEEYKTTLTPYKRKDLERSEIHVTRIETRSDKTNATNELERFYLQTDLDMSLGLEYTSPGPLFGRFQRLVHEPFHYRIQVNNTGANNTEGFVRLFLLIQRDESQQPLDLRSMQRWSIELDRFKTTIPTGASVIVRKDVESAVTVDPDAVYQRFESAGVIRSVNHCRCGMPLSLLLPRGTPQGERYKLYVMISDADDYIDPPPEEICRQGWSLCGARETKYPDKKPMGYPFDRKFASNIQSLDDFLTVNMAIQDVVIKFSDRVQEPTALLPSGLSTSWKPQ